MTEEGGVTTAVSPHQGEVESLVRDGRWDAAAVVLRERVREVPDDASALNDLGVVCHAKGAYEEAEAALDHAHAVEPENLEILHNLAPAPLSLGTFARPLRLLGAARGLLRLAQQAVARILLHCGVPRTCIRARTTDRRAGGKQGYEPHHRHHP